MKLLIVLAFATFASCQEILTKEMKEKAMELHAACLKETGADPELCLRAKKGDFVDDPKLKAQIFCFNKKAHIQSEDGKFMMDSIKEKLNTIVKDDAKVTEMMNKCVIEKDTPENSAFEASKCLYGYVPK